MSEIVTLHLGDYLKEGEMVLSGEERGAEIRKILRLDELDNNPEVETVFIQIPEIYSLNASFFMGLFYPSFLKLGYFRFTNKYHFKCQTLGVRLNISDGIRHCYLRKKF